MVIDRAFTFHICIPCGKTFSVVPRLESNIKVTFFKSLTWAETFHWSVIELSYFTCIVTKVNVICQKHISRSDFSKNGCCWGIGV